LLSGETFRCRAQDGRSGKVWPCTIHLAGTAEHVKGELTWSSLDSIHRVAGTLSGNTLKFTEVSAVHPGGAHLRCSYTLKLSGDRLLGTYQDPVDGSSGSAAIDLSADR
jgi:hypothetical protein